MVADDRFEERSAFGGESDDSRRAFGFGE